MDQKSKRPTRITKSHKSYTILPFTRNTRPCLLEGALRGILKGASLDSQIIIETMARFQKDKFKSMNLLTIPLLKPNSAEGRQLLTLYAMLLAKVNKVEQLNFEIHRNPISQQKVISGNIFNLISLKPQVLQNVSIKQVGCFTHDLLPQLLRYQFAYLLEHQSNSLTSYRVEFTRNTKPTKLITKEPLVKKFQGHHFQKLRKLKLCMHHLTLDEEDALFWEWFTDRVLTSNSAIRSFNVDFTWGRLTKSVATTTLREVAQSRTLVSLRLKLGQVTGFVLEQVTSSLNSWQRMYLEKLVIDFSGHLVGEYTLRYLLGLITHSTRLHKLRLVLSGCSLTRDSLNTLLTPLFNNYLWELTLDLSYNPLLLPHYQMIRSLLHSSMFLREFTMELAGAQIGRQPEATNTTLQIDLSVKSLTLGLANVSLNLQSVISMLADTNNLRQLSLDFTNCRLRSEEVATLWKCVSQMTSLVVLHLDLRYNIINSGVSLKANKSLVDVRVMGDAALESACQKTLLKHHPFLLHYAQSGKIRSDLLILLFLKRKALAWIRSVTPKHIKTDQPSVNAIWKSQFLRDTLPMIV